MGSSSNEHQDWASCHSFGRCAGSGALYDLGFYVGDFLFLGFELMDSHGASMGMVYLPT